MDLESVTDPVTREVSDPNVVSVKFQSNGFFFSVLFFNVGTTAGHRKSDPQLRTDALAAADGTAPAAQLGHALGESVGELDLTRFRVPSISKTDFPSLDFTANALLYY